MLCGRISHGEMPSTSNRIHAQDPCKLPQVVQEPPEKLRTHLKRSLLESPDTPGGFGVGPEHFWWVPTDLVGLGHVPSISGGS